MKKVGRKEEREAMVNFDDVWNRYLHHQRRCGGRVLKSRFVSVKKVVVLPGEELFVDFNEEDEGRYVRRGQNRAYQKPWGLSYVLVDRGDGFMVKNVGKEVIVLPRGGLLRVLMDDAEMSYRFKRVSRHWERLHLRRYDYAWSRLLDAEDKTARPVRVRVFSKAKVTVFPNARAEVPAVVVGPLEEEVPGRCWFVPRSLNYVVRGIDGKVFADNVGKRPLIIQRGALFLVAVDPK